MKDQYFTAYAISKNTKECSLIEAEPEKVASYLSKAIKGTNYILLMTQDNQPFLLCYYGMFCYCAKSGYMVELIQIFRERQ